MLMNTGFTNSRRFCFSFSSFSEHFTASYLARNMGLNLRFKTMEIADLEISSQFHPLSLEHGSMPSSFLLAWSCQHSWLCHCWHSQPVLPHWLNLHSLKTRGVLLETWHPSWVRSSCRARKYHKKLRVLASLALDVSYWIQLQHTLKQHWGNRCHLFGRGVQSCSMPAGAKIPSNRVFSHGVSKCGPWTRKSSITWELVRRVHSQTPPQNLWGPGPAICWKNFQGFWSTLQFENYWL